MADDIVKPPKRAHNFIDLTGRVFGRLTAKCFIGRIKRKTRWLCVCACGNTLPVDAGNLQSGVTKSCGCSRSGAKMGQHATHGASRGGKITPECSSWRAMKSRCLNPTATGFKNYGGRGISIDPEWLDSFMAFLRDMGPRPSGCTLERKDVNGNYNSANCIWLPHRMQTKNMRPNLAFTFNGERIIMADLARLLSFDEIQFRAYYKSRKHLPIERVIETFPLRRRTPKVHR